MMEWAHAATRGSQAGDLLELYCGAQLLRTLSLTATPGTSWKLSKWISFSILLTLHAKRVCLSTCLSK